MSVQVHSNGGPHAGLDLAPVDMAVAKHGDGPEALIPILQSIHEHYRYLPVEALKRVCEISRITPSAIEGVSTFYAQFRHKPVGKHIVRVCHGTACHVKNADVVEESLRRHLKMEPGQETDAKGDFTVEHVGCLGCCTLAPVVQVDNVTYGHLSSESAPRALGEFLARPASDGHNGESLDVHAAEDGAEIHIGVGSCCVAGGSQAVRTALEDSVAKLGLNVPVKPVGCVGMCHQTPLVEVVRHGRPNALYAKVTTAEAEAIVRRHFPPRGLIRRVTGAVSRIVDRIIDSDESAKLERHSIDVRDQPVENFLGRQQRIATENCGSLNPLDIDEYIRHDGFVALRKCLQVKNTGELVDEVKKSGLRGRGGAGFPTGQKWERARAAKKRCQVHHLQR